MRMPQGEHEMNYHPDYQNKYPCDIIYMHCMLKLLDDIKCGGGDIPGFVSRRPNAHPDMMYVGNGLAASTQDIVFCCK